MRPLALLDPSSDNTDSSTSVETKDSVFNQKSDEIRLLLNDLRCTAPDEQRLSPVIAVTPTFNFVPQTDSPTSPRLHPDRVLSELQELVERANRNKEEAFKSEASFLSVSSALNALQPVSPPSPTLQRNPLRHPQSSQSRGDIPSPGSPNSTRIYISAPATISNTPSPGLISPAPIKVTPCAPASPIAPPIVQPNALSIASPTTSSIAPPYNTTVGIYRSSSSTDPTNQSITTGVSVTRISPKAEPPQQSLTIAKTEPKAPAFRPPPPYPSKFYVKLPQVSKEVTPSSSISTVNPKKQSPPVQRRMPPEYKAPPPVKPLSQTKANQPVAPPRSKRQITSASHLPNMVAFPSGPPVPTRSFSSSSVPGIDVDAVAAVMAAAENSSTRGSSTGGSSSPTTAANKALSKALGKFHATAASFKTKFAQLSDGKDGGIESSAPTSQLKLERESSFAKPTAGNIA